MIVGITGASGFIGSALVNRHLAAGDVVRCLTRNPGRPWHPSVQLVRGDVTVPDRGLDQFADGLDVLYHCAAEIKDERRMRPVNVDGVRTLITAASGRIGRWVQLSSAGVYGVHRAGVVSEDTPLAPRGLYEQTKAEADALVIEAGRLGRIQSYAVVRPSIVFGPTMPNPSVRQLIQMVQRRLFFFVGTRGASANYIHVSNVVDALMLCARTPAAAGRIYNLSDWCTVEEFVAAIADALGRPRPWLRVPEPPVRYVVRIANRIATLPLTDSRVDALVNRSRYSIARIQRELQYSLAVPIPVGLAELVASRGPA